jgi:hypothetical protein
MEGHRLATSDTGDTNAKRVNVKEVRIHVSEYENVYGNCQNYSRLPLQPLPLRPPFFIVHKTYPSLPTVPPPNGTHTAANRTWFKHALHSRSHRPARSTPTIQTSAVPGPASASLPQRPPRLAWHVDGIQRE